MRHFINEGKLHNFDGIMYVYDHKSSLCYLTLAALF